MSLEMQVRPNEDELMSYEIDWKNGPFTNDFFLSHHCPPIKMTKRELNRLREAVNWQIGKWIEGCPELFTTQGIAWFETKEAGLKKKGRIICVEDIRNE